ncbi:snare-like protein [Durotheca rogersii]|uniref:snare-like protein n=1 Tax=Durotheca rogersii TaxID=419775 RepID=UPI00221FCE99|nr:snare-like protein [Durotheca rogersii]KAI5860777.1 snare-like protein [Durotheca rogersii]
MATAIPSIACLGVIGRNNNPLHITIFPCHDAAVGARPPVRTPLQFSLLLSSALDIFEARSRRGHPQAAPHQHQHPQAPGASAPFVSGDFGLLHAVDERLAAYGFETNTGVKFIAVVDMRGRVLASAASGGGLALGAATATTGSTGGGSSAGGAAAPAAGAPPVAARAGAGLRETELRVVFRAMQTAYVRLLQNPFYDPDEHAPLVSTPAAAASAPGKRITSRKFADEMRRIGESWAPGVTSL